MGKSNIVLGFDYGNCVCLRKGDPMKYLFVAKYTTDTAQAGVCQKILWLNRRQCAIKDVMRSFREYIRNKYPTASKTQLVIISCMRLG